MTKTDVFGDDQLLLDTIRPLCGRVTGWLPEGGHPRCRFCGTAWRSLFHVTSHSDLCYFSTSCRLLSIYIYTPPVSLFVRTPPIITSPRLLSERTLRVLCWLLILSCWGAVPFVNVYSQPFVQLSSTTLLSFSLRTMSQCYVAEPEIYFYFVEYIHTYLYIYILYRCWHTKWSVFVLESHQFYFIKPVAGWTLAYSLIVLETKVLSPP